MLTEVKKYYNNNNLKSHIFILAQVDEPRFPVGWKMDLF